MSELESRIRALQLKAPSDALDARIRSATVNDREPVRSGTGNPVAARSSILRNSSWIVAAVSLLAGICIGKWLPIGESGTMTAMGNPFSQTTGTGSGSGSSDERSAQTFDASSGFPRSVDSEGNVLAIQNNSPSDPHIAAQLVESIVISSREAAMTWERQTGQIFDVATHVSDRRFDMCRDCHRIGG